MHNKSIRNYNTGNWAEENTYYDVAISRYYYSLYQNIIYISKNKGFFKDPPSGSNSHEFMIDLFTRNVYSSLSTIEIKRLSGLRYLKKMRKTADYTSEEINKATFNSQFKTSFVFINNIMEKLISNTEG